MTPEEFSKMLDGRSVAVVGNSPSMLTMPGNGQKIDACDLVIRCNRFSLRGCHVDYVGRRIDIWATSLYREALRGAGDMLSEHKPKIAVGFERLSVDAKRSANDLGFQLPVVRLPAALQDGISKQINSRPTTGCMITQFVLQSAASSVYLSGFTFDRDARVKYYFEGNHPDNGTHDPVAEGRLLAEVIRGRTNVTMDAVVAGYVS